MVVLGEMLLDPGAATLVQGILRTEDFEIDRHRVLYAAILRCLAEHGQADAMLLDEELQRTGQLKRSGGPVYLSEVMATVVSTVNAERHAVIVLEESQRRRLTQGAKQILEMGREGKPLSELVSAAQSTLFDLRGPRLSGRHERLSGVLQRSLDALEVRTSASAEITGVTSGLHKLDRMTLGWHESELAIVAARPSVGKTALMLHMALAAAKAGHHVGLQSLEMSGISLADRLLIMEARLPGQGFRSGRLSSQDMARVAEASALLDSLPISIDESTGQTIHDVRAKARNLKAKDPDLALYMIDYVQLLKSTGALESFQKEQALASAALKDLSRELRIPVIGLAQVKRPQQGTEYRRPFLSDLKESATWEQDADVVLIVHRPETADAARAKKEGKLGLCEFWLEKQRNGPTGRFDMGFKKSELRFHPLDSSPFGEPPLE